MNEPLTNSTPKSNFNGKTYNNHPQWYNQPLRLTEEQKQNPLLVLGDFFQCYHLNDIREILWVWLTEVISSPHSISNEGQNRNNHFYFYEKIEELIEAAFVIRSEINQYVKEQEHVKSDTVVSISETVDKEDLFDKPKQLLEYVDEAPMYVIAEVFKSESLAFLRDQLRDWLHVALSADCSIYEDGEQRRQLFSFQDQLQVLVESLFIICTQNKEIQDIKNQIIETDKPRLLSRDQIANPMQVIAGFFAKFPMVYISRELNDWLEASICYTGNYPDNMDEQQAFYTYRNALCLIKAADRLIAS